MTLPKSNMIIKFSQPASPPPNTYCLPSEMEVNKRKGFGFGKGREEMLATGPLEGILRNKNPGPGSY